MAQGESTPELYARNRLAWRRWLEKNHSKVKNVRLIIYHKASQSPGIRYDEAVEEALCYGWIDGKANRRDAETFIVLFAKRSPESTWSRSNRRRVEKMLKLGRMAKAGLETVELAKRQGTWAALAPAEELVIPDDLQQALAKQPTASRNFSTFRPSSRQMILAWITTAKKPETRQKRIEETVRLAAVNISVDQYRQRARRPKQKRDS